MRRTIGIGCVSLGVLACAAAVVWAGLEVKADKENVVASRLVGKWKMHASLTQRLTGVKVRDDQWGYEFSADAIVAATIPDKYVKIFKDKPIYLAGKMRVRSAVRKAKEHPFVLLSRRGNPCVVYFRPKGDEAMGDAESLYVMLAAAKDKARDLLFVGGDFNNQPFSAFERAPAE